IVRKSTFGDGDVWHRFGVEGVEESVAEKEKGWSRNPPAFSLALARSSFQLLLFSGSPSAITRTLIDVVTSRCSLMGITYSPSFLIGSGSCSLRRSTSKPLALSASAMSLVVTEP